jgi:hypothetical protein
MANATASDAQLILQLYELRREPEMRKARDFITKFSPQSKDDVLKVMYAYPSNENSWLRQVLSYWEMAASLVVGGALNEDLFIENAGEMIFVYSKFEPFLKDLRTEMNAPTMLSNTETLIQRNQKAREGLATTRERVKRFLTASAKK